VITPRSTNKNAGYARYVYEEHDLIIEFFSILCCAHECFIDNEAEEDFTVYQGMSPDEITLVDAAARLGFKYLGKNLNMIQVEILGQKREIELLHLFPFDSDRKRMTIIARINGAIKMFCKGADSIIYSRLSKTEDQPYKEGIEKKLEEFSLIGLRTLCMAVRLFTNQEYIEFEEKY